MTNFVNICNKKCNCVSLIILYCYAWTACMELGINYSKFLPKIKDFTILKSKMAKNSKSKISKNILKTMSQTLSIEVPMNIYWKFAKFYSSLKMSTKNKSISPKYGNALFPNFLMFFFLHFLKSTNRIIK